MIFSRDDGLLYVAGGYLYKYYNLFFIAYYIFAIIEVW